MKNSKVYDSVLKQYLGIRSEYIKRKFEAQEGIDKAREKIEENNNLMSDAVLNDDQEEYTRLHTDIMKYDATIQFYEKILEKLEDPDNSHADDIEDMYSKLSEEIESVKADYNKEIEKLIDPLKEYTERAIEKITLLKLAQNKISVNLSGERYGKKYELDLSDIPLSIPVDNLIKRYCVLIKGNDLPNYSISKVASESLKEESNKWI